MPQETQWSHVGFGMFWTALPPRCPPEVYLTCKFSKFLLVVFSCQLLQMCTNSDLMSFATDYRLEHTLLDPCQQPLIAKVEVFWRTSPFNSTVAGSTESSWNKKGPRSSIWCDRLEVITLSQYLCTLIQLDIFWVRWIWIHRFHHANWQHQ